MALASLLRKLDPKPSDMTPEETAFCQKLIEHKTFLIAMHSLRTVVAFQLFSIFVDWLIVARPLQLYLLVAEHLIVAFVAGLGLKFAPNDRRWVTWTRWPLCVLMLSGYAGSLFADCRDHAPAAALIIGSLATCALGIFLVLLAPFNSRREPAGLCFFAWATVAASFIQIHDGPELIFVVAMIFLATFALKVGQMSGKWQAVRSEYREREQAKAGERDRQHHEMILANRIQDSQRPVTSLQNNTMTVDFFMIKHEVVGGDWYSAHFRPDGSLLMVVIDAVGKGFQAALVVHAVQSLWTAACRDPAFDPNRWIRSLNEVLLDMGQGSPHSIVLGLAQVTRQRITFWSAGLGSLYLWSDGAAERRMTNHPAKGSMLGVQSTAEMTLVPAEVVLDASMRQVAVLATDGVLSGSRRSDFEIIGRIAEASEDQVKRALAALPTQDDKALIRVTLHQAASRKAA